MKNPSFQQVVDLMGDLAEMVWRRGEKGSSFELERLKYHLESALEEKIPLPPLCPIGSYKVQLGGNVTIDQIRQKLKEADIEIWDNDPPTITQANFPLQQRRKEIVEMGVVDVPFAFNSDEAMEILKYADLERPTYEQAFRFVEQHHGKQFPLEHGEYIIFPHEPWREMESDSELQEHWFVFGPSDRALTLQDLPSIADYDSYGGWAIAGVLPTRRKIKKRRTSS